MKKPSSTRNRLSLSRLPPPPKWRRTAQSKSLPIPNLLLNPNLPSPSIHGGGVLLASSIHHRSSDSSIEDSLRFREFVGMGISTDNVRGLVLAISSSIFIGASFIVKKKGLMKAGETGTRAGSNFISHSLFFVIVCKLIWRWRNWAQVREDTRICTNRYGGLEW